ncbi:MAG: diaminopimelate epimerase [Propionibacteriales bacterium]|nr:diaminopimelate epimerase [Propionibacteriales bacterium]
MVSATFSWLKGHGTENDFVLLPDHDGTTHGPLAPDLVRALSDRRRGIGGDGVLRVIRTEALRAFDGRIPDIDAEWFMDYRNADGSLSEMCGNGVRVFALHLVESGLADPAEPLFVGTRGGTRTVTFGDDQISVDMGVAELQGHTKVCVGDRGWEAYRVSLGNPHAVTFVDELADAGPLLEAPVYDPEDFPGGVNVEFVRRLLPGHIAMRVYERGSGETRSCGTGACAAAVATAADQGVPRPVRLRVDVPGGRLHVRWHEDGRVDLAGPAAIVARGETSADLLRQ